MHLLFIVQNNKICTVHRVLKNNNNNNNNNKINSNNKINNCAFVVHCTK